MEALTTYHRRILSAIRWAQMGLSLGRLIQAMLGFFCVLCLALLALALADFTLARTGFYLLELVLVLLVVASAILLLVLTRKRERRLHLNLLARNSRIPPDDLESAYQLSAQKGVFWGYSPSLISLLTERVAQRVRPLFPFVRGFGRPGFLWLVLAVLLIAGIALSGYDWSALSQRALFPLKNILGAVQVEVTVEPREAMVYRGQDFAIQVAVEGNSPVPPNLYVQKDGRDEVLSLPLKHEGGGKYSAVLKKVQEDVSYWAQLSANKSEIGRLHVLIPPHLSSLTLAITPPAYSRKPEILQSVLGGVISVLPGTELELSVILEGEAEQVYLRLGDTEHLLTPQGDGAWGGELMVYSSQEFSLLAKDPLGGEVSLVEGGSLEMLADLPPTVQLLQPEGDVHLGTDLRLSLRAYAGDDYGLRGLALAYELAATGEGGVAPLLNFPDQPMGASVEAVFDFSVANPLPGDIIICKLVAFDNDTVNGPKAGYSRSFKVKVPELADFFMERERSLEFQSASTAQDVHRQGEELLEALRELGEELGDRHSLTYEQMQSMEQVIEKEQELRATTEELLAQLEQMMEENEHFISLETMAKIEEVNRRLNNLLDEQTRLMLEELQEAIDSITAEEMEPYLERALMEQERLAEELEQMLEILERVEAEMLLDAVKAQLERMLEKQKQINQQLDEGEDLGELSKEEQRLEGEADRVDHMLDQLQDSVSKFSPEAGEALSELSAEEMEELKEALREAVSAMEAGDLSGATQMGDEAQMSLEEMLSALEAMQAGYYDDQRREILEGIDELMCALSELQRQASQLSSEIDAQDNKTTPSQMESAGQMESGLGAVKRKYNQLMGKTLFLSPQGLRQLDSALEQMSSLSKDSVDEERALSMLSEAAGAMNEAMLDLWAAKMGVESASTPSGLADMLSALEQIASGQQKLGESLRSLFGGGMPTPSREQLLALAAGQAALRQALQKLMEKYSAMEELMDELQGAVQGMEGIERMLTEGFSEGRITEEQEHIMERLLSVKRSIRSKGVSTERKSEPAKYYYDPFVPQHLPPGVDIPPRFESFGVEDIYGQKIPYGYGELIERYLGGGER